MKIETGFCAMLVGMGLMMGAAAAEETTEATAEKAGERASEELGQLPLGPYLGQTPPGKVPVVFAPGLISTPAWEYGVTFSPDMKALYYYRKVPTADGEKQQHIVFEQKNGRWHQRVFGPRRGTATFSRDGSIMFFGRSYVTRTADGWSALKRLGPDFEEIRIMRVTASDLGTIVIDEAKTDSTLRIARRVEGAWEAPTPLPATINTGELNAHPFIAPDESYILWDGQRGSEVRNADLFVSFKQADGTWGDAIKFGDEINTSSSEFAASVTPDGKYLFFNRNMGEKNPDTFWVDAQVIEDLRPKK